jgi:TolB-like protein/Tfp pilus assembly protein PilF
VKIENFFAELKRRNVYKVAVAYAVVGWLLVQVTTQVFPIFEIPNWALRLIVLAIIIGFPIDLVIAWAFELTPEGITRTEDVDLAAQAGKKSHAWIYVVIVAALISVGLFFTGRYSVGNGTVRQTATFAIPEKSIAVLAFQNKSADADTEYLSDGLAESLIYRLSQLPNLKVSPTSSVFRYKGKEIDPVKIGSELGVNAVMSGRMVQRGDNLTISVDLVDVRNNKLLWGEHYERKLSELLTTQREIAAEIAQKLQLKFSGKEAKGLTKHYTDNNEAYQLYLKGRYHYAKRGRDDILKGIDYFKQAIALDPNFALAYAMIADCYTVMPAFPYLSPKEASPQTKAAAMRALEIDPTLAEAHMTLADSLAIYDWNWAEAEHEFKRALELDPNNSVTHFRYGLSYLAPLGRHEEAIAELKRAVELEPLSLAIGANLAAVYLFARQNDLALEQAEKTYDLEPSFVTGRYVLGYADNAKGMYAEAIALSEKLLQNDPANQWLLRISGYAYAKSGRPREAEEVIKRYKEIAKTQYVASYYLATIYAALGDKDKAFAELENAFANRDRELQRVKIDPFLDSLRGDPHFEALAEKIVPAAEFKSTTASR